MENNKRKLIMVLSITAALASIILSVAYFGIRYSDLKKLCDNLNTFSDDSQISAAINISKDLDRVEVACYDEKYIYDFKQYMLQNKLDISRVMFVVPKNSLSSAVNTEKRDDCTDEQFEELLNINAKLRRYIADKEYADKCAHSSFKIHKDSIQVYVKNSGVYDSISKYIADENLGYEKVDVILAPDYPYYGIDGGRNNEVNTIIEDLAGVLRDYLSKNGYEGDVRFVMEYNKSNAKYSQYISADVYSQEAADALDKYCEELYIGEGTVKIIVKNQ